MDTQIEIANKGDYEEMAEIYKSEFSKPPYNEPWTLEKALNKIEIFGCPFMTYAIPPFKGLELLSQF